MVKPVSEASFITNIIQLAQTNSQQNMVNYKVRGSSRRKGDCGIGCTTVKPAPGTWSIKTSIGHLATNTNLLVHTDLDRISGHLYIKYLIC